MITHTENHFLSGASASRFVALGAAHGYRFEGDAVYVNAMFQLMDPAAHQQQWTLQLWACPQSPFSAADLHGSHLVAEIPLPPIGEIADDVEGIELCGPAYAPAGDAEHVMVLAVASAGQVSDFAVYAQRERFIQPTMWGQVGFSMSGERVRIDVEQILNARSSENLSGTLALELWALDAPYQGGAFQGTPLAGVAIDPLPGQWIWNQLSFDLPGANPPAGVSYPVLMLREWTPAGFQTRDFANFGTPFVVDYPVIDYRIADYPVADYPMVESPVVESPVVESPVVESGTPESFLEVRQEFDTAQKAEEPAEVAGKDERKDKGKVKARRSPEPGQKSGKKKVKAPKPGKKAESAEKPKADVVSVNSASKSELAGVKGLPGKLAEEILRRRPFLSIDDLLGCKGMGAKLLAKLRSKLSL